MKLHPLVHFCASCWLLAIPLSAQLKSPESVIIYKDKLLISNVGKELNPTNFDWDGFVSMYTLDGNLIEERFLPTGDQVLNAPKGMAILGGILYVTDIDPIVGFSLSTRKQVFNLKIDDDTYFMNDLLATPQKTLLASSTNRNKIYEIDLSTQSYLTRAIQVRGANGIALDTLTQTIYVVGFGSDGQANGELGSLFITNKNPYKVISPIKGYLDGAQWYKGKLYFSDWVKFEKAGVPMVYDPVTQKTSKVDLGEKFSGSADFVIKDDVIYIPEMMGNRLSIKKIPIKEK